jgi:signal transduction histidine kinase
MSLSGLGVTLRTRGRSILLLILSTALTIVSAAYFIGFLMKPNTGLVVKYPEVVVRDGKVIFSPTAPFSVAVAAGLKPGVDQIVSVNGAPIRGSLDIVRADAQIRGYDPFTVQVNRNGSGILSVSIIPALTLSRIDWVFVMILVLALAYTAFALALKIPDEPYTVPLVLAALGYMVFTCVKPFYYQSLLSNGLIHMGKITLWLLVISGFYFPKTRGPRWLRRSLIAGILLLFALFVFLRMRDLAQWFASGSEDWFQRYRFLGQIGNVSDGAAYVCWTLLMVSAYVRTQSPSERKQIQWILAGILIALPPYFFFDQLPLILGDGSSMRMSLGGFAEVFLAFVPIFLIIGLNHHRLFNVRFLLTRYAVSVALFLLLFALFCWMYTPVRNALAAGYRLSPPVSDFFTAALAFLVLIPLWSLVLGIFDKAALKLRSRGSSGYMAGLEERNTELESTLQRVRRDGERILKSEKLSELRAIMRGIAAKIREPARRVSSGLIAADAWFRSAAPGFPQEARRPLDGVLEASLQIGDVVQALEALCGPAVSIPALTFPEVLVRSALERVRRKYPHARFDPRLEQTGKISCYPEELVDAFAYVLENAVEAQEGSTEPIAISGVQREARVVIDVEDNGMGIGEAEAKKVFRPFFTTKPGHQGLGLFFARLITEKNEGSILIEQREAGGVRCRISFPVNGARDLPGQRADSGISPRSEE